MIGLNIKVEISFVFNLSVLIPERAASQFLSARIKSRFTVGKLIEFTVNLTT